MARIRTDYKPWLKVEYRGKQIDLPHDVGYVVVNKLGEVVGYQSNPRLNGDSWDATGFAYILATNVDATRWWESLTTSGYLMDVAAGVLPREAKQQAYRNYWYAGGPIRVPTWAQWVAEDKHGNIVAIEGAMRPNISMYGKWAPKRNQLHVRRDRSGNGWRHSLMNLDHLPTMEQHLPKGFKDELRPLVYKLTELMVPSWVNFITSDPNGDIHGHHTRPSVWCNSHWMSNTSSISMCYLGYTPNHGNWKDTLLILEQKESEQKVEKEQNPQWDTKDDIAPLKSMCHGCGPAPTWLKGDDQHRPEPTSAESFTMVTFKLPSKTVATQEAMLTDEMFLAGVAFGMRLNKLLSKQGDSDVKEGS